MPDPAGRTLRRLLARAVELDVASPEAADAVRAWVPDLLDAPLGARGVAESANLAGWLVELHVGLVLPTDDVDELEAGYREALEEAAACTRGRHAVTDVTLDAGTLSFRLDGVLREREVDDMGDEYVDTLALWEDLDLFVDRQHDDVRWMQLVVDGEDLSDEFFLAEPVAFGALVAEFGVGARVVS
ncbi:hypothetical protein GTR02_07950 [Kineococcus sp. R8]|uniref:hypothetical protein n=1 Tax=Kineococcus siccus TaxID=2696567 RepID=UPI0014120265|nr:hypothetical protein [Kineococcus siccus]NAZ81750.1 hypothetical protein [Kineococcus siccus]